MGDQTSIIIDSHFAPPPHSLHLLLRAPKVCDALTQNTDTGGKWVRQRAMLPLLLEFSARRTLGDLAHFGRKGCCGCSIQSLKREYRIDGRANFDVIPF